jgi:hypothetical protein
MDRYGQRLLEECPKIAIKMTKGKVLPVLNQAACHKDIWRSGSIALRILNLSTRWRCMVSFMPWLLYPHGNFQDRFMTQKFQTH